jgi:hypothetical protein
MQKSEKSKKNRENQLTLQKAATKETKNIQLVKQQLFKALLCLQQLQLCTAHQPCHESPFSAPRQSCRQRVQP